MSIHITNTHWDRHLCPQAFKHCPAFCVSEKSHIWGLLAFAEFGMLIWCPGTVGVFLFHGDCCYEVYMGCPSSQPLLMSSILWGVAGELLILQLICASSFLGLGGSHQVLPPAGFASGWPWGPNSSLQTPLGYWSWQRENSLGWCWLQRRWHEGARRLCWFCACLDVLLSHPQWVSDMCDTLKCTYFHRITRNS